MYAAVSRGKIRLDRSHVWRIFWGLWKGTSSFFTFRTGIQEKRHTVKVNDISLSFHKQCYPYCLTGRLLTAKCSWLLPCVRMHQHMQQPCYSKLATTGLWNGTSIISFYFFALCFTGRFWQAVRRQVFETQSGGGRAGWGRARGRKALADHTIRNPPTLSGLECHSCNQPFHPRGALNSSSSSNFCHTRRFEAQRFQAIRTFNSDNLYAAVILPPSPGCEDCCCCSGLPLLFLSWIARSAGF